MTLGVRLAEQPGQVGEQRELPSHSNAGRRVSLPEGMEGEGFGTKSLNAFPVCTSLSRKAREVAQKK